MAISRKPTTFIPLLMLMLLLGVAGAISGILVLQALGAALIVAALVAPLVAALGNAPSNHIDLAPPSPAPVAEVKKEVGAEAEEEAQPTASPPISTDTTFVTGGVVLYSGDFSQVIDLGQVTYRIANRSNVVPPEPSHVVPAAEEESPLFFARGQIAGDFPDDLKPGDTLILIRPPVPQDQEAAEIASRRDQNN